MSPEMKANRKKAAQKIESAMPAGSRIDYKASGHENILNAHLPGVGSHGPEARKPIKAAMEEIGAWGCVEDWGMERDLSTSYSICVIFK